MKGLASIASGRRGKWAVLAVWLLAVVAMQPLGSKLTDETSDDQPVRG